MDRRNLLGSLVTGFMGLFAHVSEKPARKISGWLYQHIKKDGEEGGTYSFPVIKNIVYQGTALSP